MISLSWSITGYSSSEDNQKDYSERGSKIRKSKKVKNNRGGGIIRKRKYKQKKDLTNNKDLFFRLNTKKTFESVKKQNTLVFSIGNDKYQRRSGFAPLYECFNDVILLRQIFIHCVKMDPKNIFTNKDLTLSEFKKRIQIFIQKVKSNKEANVIITYSGHGDDDGSLVFVDGGRLRPAELKALVNSFQNDTTLIIDACYSGNNEGPKEMLKGVKKDDYKSNSSRIYASLAHLTAKEIHYRNNNFFKHILRFYKETLEINHKFSGNGYFTGMIGMFFAEYKFKPKENITFNDLVSYITNRGKQYVEYLAMIGHENKEQRMFAQMRLNQQPKILPIQERVTFLNQNHQFILIQKPIVPLGLEPGLSIGVFFPVGDLGKDFKSPAININLHLAYEMDFLLKRFYLVFNAGYLNLSTPSSASKRDVGLNIIIPSLGIKYIPVHTNIFKLTVRLDAGPAFTFARYGSFGAIKEESKSLTDFYFGGEIGFQLKLYRDLHLVVPGKLIYIKYPDSPLYGISTGLGVNYYF